MENYGDFCGFTFNGHHSTELGLVRVSNGNRYNDTILPAFQDKAIQVPGGDGTYFFKTFYTQKPFPIQVAFDSMTESQYRLARRVFNGKDVGELIFDEAPYKVYSAKIKEPPQLNTICFEENGQRVYKGEGTIQFICYYPYARSKYKWLEQYSDSNKDEWKDASGLLASQSDYDATDTATIKLYNPGDIESDWQAFFAFTSESICELNNIWLKNENNETVGEMKMNTFTQLSTDDVYLGINSKTQLLEGFSSTFERTGHLYGANLVAGDFFKIPLGDGYTFQSRTAISSNSTAPFNCVKLDYEYWYY